MADDVNPTRRAEYEAAVALITPQIIGLQSISNDPDISHETRDKINEELADRVRRSNLLIAALAQLDACNAAHEQLLADGYPDLPKGVVSQKSLDELSARRDAINAALDQFDMVSMTVSLGTPAAKD